MVIKDSKSLFSLIEQFDPNNKDHLRQFEELTKIYPNFHLLRIYYLKALQKQEVLSFDKNLSHASIATYDRELLYQFIESDLTPNKITKKNRKVQKGKPKKNISKNIIKEKNTSKKRKNNEQMHETAWEQSKSRFEPWNRCATTTGSQRRGRKSIFEPPEPKHHDCRVPRSRVRALYFPESDQRRVLVVYVF